MVEFKLIESFFTCLGDTPAGEGALRDPSLVFALGESLHQVVAAGSGVALQDGDHGAEAVRLIARGHFRCFGSVPCIEPHLAPADGVVLEVGVVLLPGEEVVEVEAVILGLPWQ